MLNSGVKPHISQFKKPSKPFKKSSFLLQINPLSFEKKSGFSFMEQNINNQIEAIRSRNEEIEKRIVKIQELKHKLDPEKTSPEYINFLEACDNLEKISYIIYNHYRINYIGTQEKFDEKPQIASLNKFEKNIEELKKISTNMNMYMTANVMFVMTWFNNIDNRIALDIAKNLYGIYLGNYNKFMDKIKISAHMSEDLILEAEKLFGKEVLNAKCPNYKESLEFLNNYSKTSKSQYNYLFFGNEKYQKGKNTSTYVAELNENKKRLQGLEASMGMIKTA